MNRRELLFGTLLAPLVKPLACLLPAGPRLHTVATRLTMADLEYSHAFDRVLARKLNAAIEDQMINGYDPGAP